jgi:hypothetical protein
MRNRLINADRLHLPLIVSLLASAAVHAQQINVTAANASNDAIYSVAFSGSSGSIKVLNTDGGSLHNLTSLVFYPNTVTFQLDLLAADNGGQIVRYPGDFQGSSPTTGTVVFAAGGPPGPQNPDGLSTDSAGNLFVVNSKNGSTSNPQLWVMTPDGLGGFINPVSIDSAYGSSEVLDDTLVVGTTIVPAGAAVVTASVAIVNNAGVLTVSAVTGTVVVGALITGSGVPANTMVTSQLTGPPGGTGSYQLSNAFTVASETLTQPVLEPGDLLVLTTNPSQVLRYANVNGHGPTGPATPTVLLTLPAGVIPGGLAFWPPDNSLLISTSRGTIYQYHFATGDPATFASGLGNGQFKVKTGIQFGVPYAYVANNNGGDILQFAGPNQLQATVTSGVQHPQGLATTNIAYAPVSACQQTNGCSLLGGSNLPGGSVITHSIPSNLHVSGNVVENVCLVPVDPRLVPPSTSCTTDLPVSAVCAGFSDTVVIPASLCGSSGSTKKGFALIKTLTQAYGGAGFPFNGSLISNDSNLQNVLPVLAGNPVCNPSKKGVGPSPLGTLAWAPLAGEGIVVEGNDLLETASGCDGSTNKQTGLSLFGVGLAVNVSSPADLVNFASAKYTTLLGEQSSEVSNLALVAPIPPSQQPPAGNFTYQLQQCISTSQGAFAAGSNYYSGAAAEVLTADQNILTAVTTPPNPNPFTANTQYPNPSGSLRWRLENIYYTINTRIQLNLAASGPPSQAPSPPPPTITGTPPKASAGVPYSFTPSAHDFAHQTATSNLFFSIAGQPSWVTGFDPTTGTLSGTPPKGGSASGIVITVYDGCTSTPLSISIKVTG